MAANRKDRNHRDRFFTWTKNRSSCRERTRAAVECRSCRRRDAGERPGRNGPTTAGGAECGGDQCLLQLGADLEAAWHHPAATAATHKRIIRAVVGDPADSGCEGSPDRNRTEALREAHCPDFERTPKRCLAPQLGKADKTAKRLGLPLLSRYLR